jgi:hypothetical protein
LLLAASKQHGIFWLAAAAGVSTDCVLKTVVFGHQISLVFPFQAVSNTG